MKVSEQIRDIKRTLRAWREEFSSGDSYKRTVINSLIRDLELAALASEAVRPTDANTDEQSTD